MLNKMQKSQLAFTISCLVLGLIVSIWVVNLNFTVDADVANSSIVWHEIQQHGWSVMKNWLPTPDNWYFSVYPIHFLLFELTGSTSPDIMYGVSIAQLFLCATLMAAICYERSNNTLSFLLVPFFCGLSQYAVIPGYITHPFSHNITNLYGLLCLYLYLINIRKRKNSIDILIYILVIIASVSDPWMLAAYYLPLLFATCYQTFILKMRERKALIIPALTGIILFTHAIEHLLHLPIARFKLGSVEQMLSNGYWFLYGLGGMLNLFMVQQETTFIISALLIIGMYLLSIRKPLRISTADFLILMSILGITSSFILGETPAAQYSARFLVNIIYLSIGCIFLRAISDRKVFLIPLLMLTVSGYASHITLAPHKDRPSTANVLVKFLRANDLHYGYGPYWGTDALATTWYSNWQQIIRPITFDIHSGEALFVDRGQTFVNWYDIDSENAPTRQFVAIKNDGETCPNVALCSKGVVNQFGIPDQTLKFNDTIFLIYNKKLISDLAIANLSSQGHLTFGGSNKAYLWRDWSWNQENYRWTDGYHPTMLLNPPTNWKTGKFLLHALTNQPLKGTLSANGIVVKKLNLSSGVHEITFSLENNVPNKALLILRFDFEVVKSPRDLKMNGDPRKLGLQVSNLDYSFE
ncbi:hypothetical protein SC206_21750 [Rouxiella sp. T17]|uniref:hypothetical protein n=1 Tax=Rouxiella sp. T17 TaxID=3085684 RepID=UPI002FC8842D